MFIMKDFTSTPMQQIRLGSSAHLVVLQMEKLACFPFYQPLFAKELWNALEFQFASLEYFDNFSFCHLTGRTCWQKAQIHQGIMSLEINQIHTPPANKKKSIQSFTFRNNIHTEIS